MRLETNSQTCNSTCRATKCGPPNNTMHCRVTCRYNTYGCALFGTNIFTFRCGITKSDPSF